MSSVLPPVAWKEHVPEPEQLESSLHSTKLLPLPVGAVVIWIWSPAGMSHVASLGEQAP